MLDLASVENVVGLRTQALKTKARNGKVSGYWVASYSVQYSNDTLQWRSVPGLFNGNTGTNKDHGTDLDTKVTARFPALVRARDLDGENGRRGCGGREIVL